LSAVVGYRTARGLSTASTAALAAGGLAGYTLDQFLIQPSRLVVYDKAYTAISCALSIYSEENGALVGKYSDYGAVLAAKSVFDTEVTQAEKQGLSPEDETALAGLVVEAAFLATDIRQLGTTALDARLGAAAQRIEGELATAITTTALPITALSSQVETFGKATSSTDLPQDKKAVNAFLTIATKFPRVAAALERLRALHEHARETITTSESTADFSKCSVGVVQVQNPGIEQPLMLGVDNVDAGTTKEFKAVQQVTVQVVGGRTPHDAKATAGDELDVKLVPVGATRAVVIKSNEKTKQGQVYEVLVSDAAGSLRKFFVKLVE
jgi:hypothetical protein